MASPTRCCIGCRRVAPAQELMRMVRGEDGSVRIGRALPGRGAWLCAASLSCFDLARRRRAFGRALRGAVREDALDSLRANLVERARIGSRDN